MIRAMISAVCLLLIACSKEGNDRTLKVAASPIPQAQILQFVRPKLEAQGVVLKILQMDDYQIPNRALSEKEVDANYFQHIPFMEEQIKDFGYKIQCYARMHLEPMGLYSKKISSLEDLAPRSVVAIPNDPTNEYRALILLEKEGLITLKQDVKFSATIASIAENPKNLVFREIDAAMLARTLSSVSLAAIPTNFALQIGLSPEADALALESKNSPYVNIIAIVQGTEDDPRLEKLRAVLLTEEVREFILDRYKGAIVPVLERCSSARNS